MPCIPIGLFDPHVSPFLPVFFISFIYPFPYLVLYFIGPCLSNIWIGDTMPLCFPFHELYSVHTMLVALSIKCHTSTINHLFMLSF